VVSPSPRSQRTSSSSLSLGGGGIYEEGTGDKWDT